VIPERIVRWIGDPGVEAHLIELLTLAPTDQASEARYVVVGIGVAEGFADGVKEILPVNEDDGAFDQRFRRHPAPQKRITPPEAFRRVEWGASARLR